MRSLEEAEAKYIETLRKARPDLAEQVNYVQEKESRPPRIRRYRLMHTWFLCFLQSSMRGPRKSRRWPNLIWDLGQ
jgi:hypothetical protein